MPSPRLKQTDLIFICAQRDFGKTTLCKALQRSFPRLVIIDLMREYTDAECDFRVQSVEDLARVLIALTKAKSQKFRIAIQFDIERDDEVQAFDLTLHLLYKFGNCMIVIEEIHNYMRGEWLPEWLRKVILCGAHAELGILATSQKPATVSKIFTSQCRHWFVGPMFERNDMKYFRDSIGGVAETLPKLPIYRFLHVIPSQQYAKIVSAY